MEKDEVKTVEVIEEEKTSKPSAPKRGKGLRFSLVSKIFFWLFIITFITACTFLGLGIYGSIYLVVGGSLMAPAALFITISLIKAVNWSDDMTNDSGTTPKAH